MAAASTSKGFVGVFKDWVRWLQKGVASDLKAQRATCKRIGRIWGK